jgi:hypothetical protein
MEPALANVLQEHWRNVPMLRRHELGAAA